MKYKSLFGVILAVLILFILTGISFGQEDTSVYPGPPTNIKITPADTSAVIKWDAPTDDDCPASHYNIWVTKESGGERIENDKVQSPWIATGLAPSTDYHVVIYSYGESCSNYSEKAANAPFSTTADDSAPDVVPAEKHVPLRVSALRTFRASCLTDSVDLSWNAPDTRNGKHHSATKYAIYIYTYDHTGNVILVRIIDHITDTRATIDGLNSGQLYQFEVAAYSAGCDCWGLWQVIRYTH